MSLSILIEIAWFVAGAVAFLGLANAWQPGRSWRRGAGYLLLTLLFFRPALTHGGYQLATDLASQWLPWREAVPHITIENPLLADPVLQLLPVRSVLRERLLRGEVPRWIDELGTGQPVLGHPLLMPFFLLTLGLPPLQALTVAAMWQVFLALILTHLLLSRLGASQAGATLGALAFALSTFSVVWLYYPLSATACWLPGVLLSPLLLRDRARGGAAGLVVCGCGMVLGGHPETLAHSALAVVVVAVWLMSTAGDDRWRLLGRIAGVAAVVACLTAPSLLAIAGSILGSERLAQLAASPHDVGPTPFEPRGLALLIDPLATGSPRDGNWSGPSNFNETASGYGGAAVLALAVAGAFVLRRRIAAIVGGGTLALLVAFGIAPFVAVLAPFVVFQHAANARLRFVWVFALAVAAGLTIDRLATDRTLRRMTAATLVVAGVLLLRLPPPETSDWQRAWWLATLGGLALLLATIAHPRGRPWTGAVACVVTALDLLLLGGRYNPTPGPEFELAPPPALEAVVRQSQRDRPVLRVAALGWDLMPNLAALYGLGDPRGNDPTRPAAAARFVGQRLGGSYSPGAQVRIPERWFDQGALNYLAVRFLLTRHRRELPAPWRTVFNGQGGRVWENPDTLPPFFFPRSCRVAGTAAEAMVQALATTDFQSVAVVEGGATCQPAQAGEVTATRRVSDGFDVGTNSRSGGLVVSSVSAAPGWEAATDRGPLTVRRVNGAFLGVEVPPGRQLVRLRYRPLLGRLGEFLAGAAVLSLVAGAWWRRRRAPAAPLRALTDSN